MAKQVKIDDELADLISTPRGTAVADDHVSSVGSFHTNVVVEDGTVKVLNTGPGGPDIPTQYRARKYHTAIKPKPVENPAHLEPAAATTDEQVSKDTADAIRFLSGNSEISTLFSTLIAKVAKASGS